MGIGIDTLIGLLIIWISSTVISFGGLIANELRMFKDVADQGYKINSEKMVEVSNSLNPNASKLSLLSLLIPIVNIMDVTEKMVKYNKYRSTILSQLSALDCLDQMTDEEKEMYNKKPTGLNAFLIPIKMLLKQNKRGSVSFEYQDENGNKGIIYGHIDDESKKIIIDGAEGIAVNLTKEEQLEKIKEMGRELLNGLENKYSSEENMKKSIAEDLKKNNNTIEVNLDETKEEDISISRQIEELKQFKKENLSKTEQNSNNFQKRK